MVTEAVLIALIILSTYKPILSFPVLYIAKKMVKAGEHKKAGKYLAIARFTSITTASRLEYKIILADLYSRTRRYFDSYNTLFNIKQKPLRISEIDMLEMHMAFYLIRMGSLRAAKRHIDNVKNKTPLLLLLETNILDATGMSSDCVFEKIESAVGLITPKTSAFDKAQKLYST